MTYNKNFYSKIYEELKSTSNLIKIKDKFNISKQNLNNYLRLLRKDGLIKRISKGYYEVINPSKRATKYDSNLPKDIIRGHAFVWTIKITKEISNWDRRIDILNSNKINYKLVGLMKNIPRIKILGRKIWLCNDKIRVFDKKNTSYYGDNAIESKRKALITFLEIVSALENKLNISFKPLDFEFNKEHYALIKNDLAIEHNKKGIILRISDNNGEWLLIDDSLEQGGELENVGKSSFNTNLTMQKWWNSHKETNFKVTPEFVLNAFNKQIQTQEVFRENMESHIKAIQELALGVQELRNEVKRLHENK